MEPNDNSICGDRSEAVDLNANDDQLRRSIKNAENRVEELHNFRDSLTDTISQMTNHADKIKREVEETFGSITETVIRALNERRSYLLQEISNRTEDTIQPILVSRDIVDGSLQSAREYLDKVNKILQANHSEVPNLNPPNQHTSIVESVSESLSSSEAVLNLSVHFNQAIVRQTLDDISKFGNILNLTSLQIVETKERPGALAIRWEEKEYDSEPDSNFRLQCCVGDVRKNKNFVDNFKDIYVGCETFHVARHLNPNTDYSFRVCRHRASESDWSLPLVAQTNLLPYVWSSGNQNYSIFNGAKSATKLTANRSILFSSSPQFKYKHSTQFKIIQCAASLDDDGVGLWIPIANSESGNAIQPGVILVSAQGFVYMNGVKMTTRLPRLSEGSVITFDSEEQLAPNKMRITITHEEKQVTYDWNLDCGSTAKSEDSELSNSDSVYFFMSFLEVGWSVVVQ